MIVLRLQMRNARAIKLIEWDLEHPRHLIRIGANVETIATPDNKRRNAETRSGRIVVERSDHMLWRQIQPEFLMKLAQCSLL